MALLLLRGFSTPSLLAQGEQRLPSYFNIDRDIPHHDARADMDIPESCRKSIRNDQVGIYAKKARKKFSVRYMQN
jgi:hypothetical protein